MPVVILNPVRTGLVRRAVGWRWSSYRATAGLEEPPGFLTTDWILAQFAGDRRKAQQAYQRFVTQGVEGSPWEDLRGQIFLGSAKFIESIPIPRREKLREIPRAQWSMDRPSLGKIFRRRTVEESIAVAYWEYEYKLREIAEHLRVHYATVSCGLRRFEEKRTCQ